MFISKSVVQKKWCSDYMSNFYYTMHHITFSGLVSCSVFSLVFNSSSQIFIVWMLKCWGLQNLNFYVNVNLLSAEDLCTVCVCGALFKGQMFECLSSFRYSCFVLDCSALVHNIQSFKEEEVNLICFFLALAPTQGSLSAAEVPHGSHQTPCTKPHLSEGLPKVIRHTQKIPFHL